MTYKDLIDEWKSDVPFVVCHTSGSTGKPTQIKLLKEDIINSARRSCDYFGITQSSLLYSCVSPDYIGGKMMLIRSIVSGAKFLSENPSNHPLANYTGQDIDLLSIVPSQMHFLLNHPQLLKKVKTFLIGGSAIHDTLRQNIINQKVKAYESYGMTETASHIALRRIDTDEVYFSTLDDIRVEYHSGNLLSIAIGDKKFYTNDIAEIKSPHEFKILGRADNIIISGGKKFSPEILEEKLSKILDFPFYISSRKDEKWGEKLVLVTTELLMEEEKLLALCRSCLDPHEVPKEVVKMQEFTYTGNNKIKRLKFD